jgi:tetratricopeptide (TPR) repeat protein
LGCSIYLYLPFRALNSPALNWGNPTSLEKVVTAALALKSVKQIGLTLNYTLLERIKDAWMMIYSQFTFLPFLLSLTGLFFLLRKHFKLFVFFLLLILGNSATIIILPSEFISTSLDFQGYILPVIFSFSFMFGVGILFLLKSINEWIVRSNFSSGFNKSLKIVFSIFFFSISLLPFLTFYRLADLSKNDLAYRYGKSVLSQLSQDAIVIIDNPNLYFILSALRYGEGYRRDVAVLDRSLLQAQWNCQQERKNYPKLFSDINADLRGEYLFLSLMTKGLNRNFPVYMEYTERDSGVVNFLSPAGYLYRFDKRVSTKLSPELLKNQRDFENSFYSQREDKIFQRDVDALRMFVYITYRWGLYYEQKGMLEDALRNFSSALQLDPLSPEFQDRVKNLKNRIQLAKN